MNTVNSRRKYDREFKLEAVRLVTQYAGHASRSVHEQHHFSQSMNATGNFYDNAVMESFFHTLKTEVVYFEG